MSSAPLSSDVSLDAPSAPRRPSARAKRLVFRYTGAQSAVLWIGIAFLGIGLSLAVPFCWGLPVDLVLLLDAIEVRGTVLEASLNPKVSVNDVHPMRVRFEYVLDGERYEGASNVFESALAELSPGMPIDLEVSERRPTWARVAGTRYSLLGWFGALSLLFPIVGGTMLFGAIRSNRREVRAFVWGAATAGEVFSAGYDRSTRINGRHHFQIRWSFRAEGRTYKGALSSMEPAELKPFARGVRVCVLYDPANPRINTIYVD